MTVATLRGAPSPIEYAVLDALRASPAPMTASALVVAVGRRRNTVRDAIYTLTSAGHVRRAAPPPSVPTHNTGLGVWYTLTEQGRRTAGAMRQRRREQETTPKPQETPAERPAWAIAGRPWARGYAGWGHGGPAVG